MKKIVIDEVQNGFLLKLQHNEKEDFYVFSSIEKLTAWLNDHFKRKEKSKEE